MKITFPNFGIRFENGQLKLMFLWRYEGLQNFGNFEISKDSPRFKTALLMAC